MNCHTVIHKLVRYRKSFQSKELFRASLDCTWNCISSKFSSVNFTFIEAKDPNVLIKISADEGKTLLDVALDHNIDIEGACGGELACSTCHVILTQEIYDKLPSKSEEEQDMLDLAWGLKKTSRLSCQIKISKELEGALITVPSETNNML